MTDPISTAVSTAFRFNQVTVGYGRRTVLRDVTIELPAGRWLGVLGPNGAGKTTLLRALSGVLLPSQGTIEILGRDPRAWSPRERARLVAYVPQSLHLPVPYSLHDLVAIGRTPHLGPWTPLNERDELAIRQSLQAVDLALEPEARVEELSEGERQRAVLALALAQEPRLLLLDEPTAHLDIQHAWSILKTVERLVRNRGLTVVMTSHDLNMAGMFCSDLMLLDEGRLVAQGPPAQVLTADILSRVYHHPLSVHRLAERNWVMPASILPESMTNHSSSLIDTHPPQQ